eukprot:1156436-Pelagomonas_calceolata.AAC.4
MAAWSAIHCFLDIGALIIGTSPFMAAWSAMHCFLVIGALIIGTSIGPRGLPMTRARSPAATLYTTAFCVHIIALSDTLHTTSPDVHPTKESRGIPAYSPARCESCSESWTCSQKVLTCQWM